MSDIFVPKGTVVEITTPRKQGAPAVERVALLDGCYIDDARYILGDDTVSACWEYTIGMSRKSTVRARKDDVRVINVSA